MSKLLTIAIPTFNRAELLNKQLTWLAQALRGFEAECEILVSDNCSTDNTQDVVKRCQSTFSHITVNYNRNNENVGVLKNVAYCLHTATTKYVWAIGDDDPIEARAVTYVLTKIKEYKNLSLLFLNFSGRNKITGEPVSPRTIIGNRWFDADSEDGRGDGKAIFEHCYDKSVGAVIFLTATVYRTELVQRALDIWKDAPNNWIFLAYLAGYCAEHGSVIVTQDVYMECVVGVSYWQKEQKSALLMQYKHIPEVLIKLEENGYSKQFCRRMIVKNLKEVNLKVVLGALRRWPFFTIKTVIPFLALILVSAFQLISSRKVKTVEFNQSITQQI
ncbi:MAG: glycosyltransferase [Chroococcidiopsidaceae cyanobacterium CP_BM_ER_R8_30]|nr:glycosyltransferase [Chroococcidiopsidaceae cyanobacterium CP_BM_ER_R8_30]